MGLQRPHPAPPAAAGPLFPSVPAITGGGGPSKAIGHPIDRGGRALPSGKTVPDARHNEQSHLAPLLAQAVHVVAGHVRPNDRVRRALSESRTRQRSVWKDDSSIDGERIMVVAHRATG